MFKFNPLTGKLDLVGGSGGSDPTTIADKYIVEPRTLTALEAANKEITLDNTPPDPTKVTLDIVSGTSQEYGTDYTVAGDVLSWDGLGLDVTLHEGDKIRVIYPL